MRLLVFQIPKVGGKKDLGSGPLPADLAKRPEITITPIPRSLNDTLSGLAAAAAAAANQQHSLMGASSAAASGGFPANCLKALGIDFSSAGLDINMVDFNALNNLAELAQKYEKSNQVIAAAVAACEPAAKRFKADDSRLNGTRYTDQRGTGRASAEQSVPDLVSADFLRSMNMLDANSKLLLPAHQSTKTINALAALLPQTSIFPAPAPAAHQQNSTRSPLKTSQSDTQRQEPPRVFQSQSLYTQGNRIYDKPIPDVTSHSTTSLFTTSSPKESTSSNSRDTISKSSSPEIEILDLSRPPGGTSLGKNGKSSKCDRLDMELLDLSARRDITVSAVPKPANRHHHHHHPSPLHHHHSNRLLTTTMSSVPQVNSLKSSLASLQQQQQQSSSMDTLTITPNHSNSNTRNYRNSASSSNSSNNGSMNNAALGNSPDLSSLMSGMPGAALMAVAAAAAQGQSLGLGGQSLGLGGQSLGLGGLGLSGGTGSIPASLLPFLIGPGPVTSAASGNTGGSSSPSPGGNNSSSKSVGGGNMFSYIDPNSLAAYYSSLLPHSLLSTTAVTSASATSLNNSIAAVQQAAAVQMAHAQLNSLGLTAASVQQQQQQEALANLGMYKNFLAAAASSNNSSNNGNSSSPSSLPPPHFLAALMSPGNKQKK